MHAKLAVLLRGVTRPVSRVRALYIVVENTNRFSFPLIRSGFICIIIVLVCIFVVCDADTKIDAEVELLPKRKTRWKAIRKASRMGAGWFLRDILVYFVHIFYLFSSFLRLASSPPMLPLPASSHASPSLACQFWELFSSTWSGFVGVCMYVCVYVRTHV